MYKHAPAAPTCQTETGRLIIECVSCGADYAAVATSPGWSEAAAVAERLGWTVRVVNGQRTGESGRWWWRAHGACPRCAAERKSA